MSSNSNPAEADHPVICTVDPYDYMKLNITRNPSGSSITRTCLIDAPLITTDDRFISPIQFKDVTLDQAKKTWFRVYVSRFAPPGNKLPLVLYFHGGGFILFSATSELTHQFCSKLASTLPAVVVSLDYRLAPEHKLPAAYEDAIDLVHNLKSSGDELLESYADFSNCFIMGSSSGGNIAFQVGLKLVKPSINGELGRLKIRGLVLLHAFFGGVERSASELRLINGPILPLSVTDLMWELALPEGADRDHEYCHLREDSEYADDTAKMREMGWRVLVVGGTEDPLVDRQMEAVSMLERGGVEVESVFGEGDVHVAEWFDESKGRELYERLRRFIVRE